MIVTERSKLTSACKKISVFEAYDVIEKLSSELKNAENGVGLAANQIGIDASVCIIRLKESIDLVNPEIIERFDKSLFVGEGCLSFPGEKIVTERYAEILVKDLFHPNGFVAFGIEAVVIQHEIDHLNGKTMHDRKVIIPAGRNDLCWCGSGKKYKICHLRNFISQ